MNSQTNDPDLKKTYETPRVVTINLRPEEAVLGHCKTMSTGGSNGGTCSNFFAPCVATFGS
jgi:hypothetical protein